MTFKKRVMLFESKRKRVFLTYRDMEVMTGSNVTRSTLRKLRRTTTPDATDMATLRCAEHALCGYYSDMS